MREKKKKRLERCQRCGINIFDLKPKSKCRHIKVHPCVQPNSGDDICGCLLDHRPFPCLLCLVRKGYVGSTVHLTGPIELTSYHLVHNHLICIFLSSFHCVLTHLHVNCIQCLLFLHICLCVYCQSCHFNIRSSQINTQD